MWDVPQAGVAGDALIAVVLLYVAVVGPAISHRRYQRMVAAAARGEPVRAAYYRRLALGQGVRTAIALASIAALSLGFHRTGVLSAPPRIHLHVDWGPTITGLVIGLSVQVAVIARGKRLPGVRRLAPMLPRTRNERLTWLGLSAGAGVSEELMFRAALPCMLLAAFPGLGVTGALWLQAIAFGIGHLYQGPAGVVGTGAVGLLLGTIVLATGSIWLAVAIHAAFDMRIVAIPASYLRRFDPVPESPLPA